MQNNHSWKEDLLELFPMRIRAFLEHIDGGLLLEEIRLRAGQPIQLVFNGYERLLYAAGGRPVVTQADCMSLVERMCEHSIYAWEEEMRMGFLTLPGGYRVGLCGRAVMEDGKLHHISDITSLNIRIARACLDTSAELLPYLLNPMSKPYTTLIISPPGCGKTTMLRDIAYQLSYGRYDAGPCRVCVVDERMEIAGSIRGMAQHDIGPRTDVLSGCPKSQAIPLLVRTLAPDVLITDELGGREDAKAVLEAIDCGVTVIASAHASHINALMRRGTLQGLIQKGIFERIVMLGRSNGVGSIECIWNENLQELKEGNKTCSKCLF